MLFFILESLLLSVHPYVCLYVGTFAQMMFSELLSHSEPYSLFSNLTKNTCFKIVYKKVVLSGRMFVLWGSCALCLLTCCIEVTVCASVL